ncbi:hypothetical protein CVT24_007924 [Panaeolus cyanescens]|uniref:F-box domain-containing protein n=1 Tax=Panaeolus cyanescens TaxID=181874 RepID=A0A409WWJ3_9AGAR|nr:hypothetical protein CVT24_007924 [Panaeolus cyanescens]
MHAVLKNQYLVHEILKFLHQERQANITLPQSSLDAITSFTHLRELNADFTHESISITHSDLSKLAQLDQLSILDLNLRMFDWGPEKSESESESTSCSTLSFPQLEKLTITCKLDDAAKLLALTTFPILSSITLQSILPLTRRQLPPSTQWISFFKALRNSMPSNTLRELYLFPTNGLRHALHAPPAMQVHQGILFSEISKYVLPFNLVALSFAFPLLRSLSMGDLGQMLRYH